MCCWIIIAFAFAPRVALFFMWLFTNRISAAFDTIIFPILGFIFMPWTTLVYILVAPHGISAIDIILLVIAIGADLGIWGGSTRRRTSR